MTHDLSKQLQIAHGQLIRGVSGNAREAIKFPRQARICRCRSGTRSGWRCNQVAQKKKSRPKAAWHRKSVLHMPIREWHLRPQRCVFLHTFRRSSRRLERPGKYRRLAPSPYFRKQTERCAILAGRPLSIMYCHPMRAVSGRWRQAPSVTGRRA